MQKTAFVLGGSGLVGRHIGHSLVENGWTVTIGSRGLTSLSDEISGFRHVALDRTEGRALENAVASGFDVIVDVIPYERADGEQLLRLNGSVGSVIAISTTSVYTDDQGRTMDEAETDKDFPRLPVPIPETQATTPPSDRTYSTKKAAIEELLLGQSELPATVIRPCAIYGPGDTQCREWFFVKRALDKRPFVLLARRGEVVCHTTAARNLAELVRLSAENPGTRVLNCGDPDPPSMHHIASSIASAMGYHWEEVLVPESRSSEQILSNPWNGAPPWVVDMRKAHDELGYEPLVTYDHAILETVNWIVDVTRGRRWQEVLPQAAEYLGDRFDYQAEDTFLRTLS